MSNSITHIAIIPDGNRRWAQENNLSVMKGYTEGYKRVKELLTAIRKHDIRYATFWFFSTENWLRSDSEVDELLSLLILALTELQKEVQKEKIRFVHLGRKDRLGEKINSRIDVLEIETKEYTDFCLCVAIDYGGEDEIVRAEQKLAKSNDSTKSILNFLDTTLVAVPNPDFIIRTSGEQRTSGFMPLQSVYSEWLFTETLFPDFGVQQLESAIEDYKKRIRRHGK